VRNAPNRPRKTKEALMASPHAKMDVVPKRGRGVHEILAQSRRPLPVRAANLLGRDASGQVVATGDGIE
jgi:hypothetical protein